jgi:hypothetical protein
VDATHATLELTLAVMHRLAHAQIATWLCGGWAEELHGLAPPRLHHDVDLVYPAPTFARLDRWLAAATDLRVIPAKRFSHKRAMLCDDVMVEVLLLEPQGTGYLTRFFDGAFQLVWPAGTLSQVFVGDRWVPVASAEALRLYRGQHHRVDAAYKAQVQTLRPD